MGPELTASRGDAAGVALEVNAVGLGGVAGEVKNRTQEEQHGGEGKNNCDRSKGTTENQKA
jgi:hypothetical protein